MKTDIKTFFYYNWWKFVIVIILILATVYFSTQCSSRVNTDFAVLYVSETETADSDVFKEAVKNTGIIEDTDSEDGLNVILKEIYIPEDINVMHQQRIPEQIRLELVSGESTLYILDKETIYENEVFDIFCDMKPLAEKFNIDDENLYITESGMAAGISLKGNRFLNSNGAPCDSLYLCIKNHDDTQKAYEMKNAIKFAEYILRNK